MPALPFQQAQLPVCRSILVACIGNIFLGDDGFGVEVAQALAQRTDPEWPPGVQMIDFGIRGMDLAYTLLDGHYDAVILVDAVPRGNVPGTLYVLEVPWLDDSYSHSNGQSGVALDAHSMDPVKVLAFARSMGAQPVYTLLVGCEPGCPEGAGGGDVGGYAGMQMGLSKSVRASIGAAVETLDVLIARLVRE
jgi:hydrogenase maturation protease